MITKFIVNIAVLLLNSHLEFYKSTIFLLAKEVSFSIINYIKILLYEYIYTLSEICPKILNNISCSIIKAIDSTSVIRFDCSKT